MRLAEKLLKSHGKNDDANEIVLSLEAIKKSLPYIEKRIPHGSSEESTTAKKAVETFGRFTDTLLKDLKKEGVLSTKIKKGIKNYIGIVTQNINPDIMKVIDRKQKNVKFAIDDISSAMRVIDTLYRLQKD